jgi:hypothetical protein
MNSMYLLSLFKNSAVLFISFLCAVRSKDNHTLNRKCMISPSSTR